MWVSTGEEWININDAAVRIEPVGNKCNVLVVHPALKAPVKFTGSQANGIIEDILKRRIYGSDDALDVIFRRVSEEKDLSHNGNGTRKRKPKEYKDRALSVSIMKKSASARWALKRGELELAEQYKREAEALKSSRSVG